MGTRPAVFILACALVASACGASPSAPDQPDALRLTASIDRTVIPPGETATITYKLENPGSSAVKLTFPDSCQISPYISSSFGLIVYPQGGDWVCATVLTELSIPAHGSKTMDVQVRAGGQASYPYVALGQGQYRAYARVKSSTQTLTSKTVSFTVQ